MADYIAQPDTAVDPDAPVTSDLMYALRDNPIAIAEGAAGAPRIRDAALSGTVTVAGRNWVANRYSTQPWDGVGQVVMARVSSGGTFAPGDLTGPGVIIRAANVAGSGPTSALPGVWMCMGYANASGTTAEATTIWKRVS